MFDVSPVSQKIKSQSLAKPSRKCSDASPTSVLSAAWRSKKCRSFKKPQHSFGRLWVEGLSTFAPPQRRGPGRRYPHRRRCTSHRQLRSTPPCVYSGPSAPSRWRWLLTTSPPADKCGWKRSVGASLEMLASTWSARTPTKFCTKSEFWRRHGIKRCNACVLALGWTKCIEMWCQILSNFVSTSHTSNLANETPREFLRQTSAWANQVAKQLEEQFSQKPMLLHQPRLKLKNMLKKSRIKPREAPRQATHPRKRDVCFTEAIYVSGYVGIGWRWLRNDVVLTKNINGTVWSCMIFILFLQISSFIYSSSSSQKWFPSTPLLSNNNMWEEQQVSTEWIRLRNQSCIPAHSTMVGRDKKTELGS